MSAPRAPCAAQRVTPRRRSELGRAPADARKQLRSAFEEQGLPVAQSAAVVSLLANNDKLMVDLTLLLRRRVATPDITEQPLRACACPVVLSTTARRALTVTA